MRVGCWVDTRVTEGLNAFMLQKIYSEKFGFLSLKNVVDVQQHFLFEAYKPDELILSHQVKHIFIQLLLLIIVIYIYYALWGQDNKIKTTRRKYEFWIFIPVCWNMLFVIQTSLTVLHVSL